MDARDEAVRNSALEAAAKVAEAAATVKHSACSHEGSSGWDYSGQHVPDCPYAIAQRIRALQHAPARVAEGGTLQSRVAPWMQACFGPEISADKIERNHRFIEEALELVQANGCTRSEAHQLVDYTFSRPVGAIHQECGGVLITLAALCLASGLDMEKAGEDELARIWVKIDTIRKKQAAKPKHSPLPSAPDSPAKEQ